MSRQRFLVLVIIGIAPLWGLFAYIGYELSQARKALEEQQQAEREAYEDAMRELDALRVEILHSTEQRTRDLKALREEVSVR